MKMIMKIIRQEIEARCLWHIANINDCAELILENKALGLDETLTTAWNRLALNISLSILSAYDSLLKTNYYDLVKDLADV